MAAEDLIVQSLMHFSAPGKTSVPVLTGGIEAATQSYKAGAPLINSSGKLATAAEDVTTAIILGFACANATGVTSTAADIIPAINDLSFEAQLEDGTSGGHALAQTDLYAKYGLAVTAAGFWYIDQVETSATAVIITAFVDPIGTVAGKVRARLLRTLMP